MRNNYELDGATFRIARNGDLSFGPSSRNLNYLFLIAAGLLIVWLAVKQVMAMGAVVSAILTAVILSRWANQPRVQITSASGMITWRRWFRRRQYPFSVVSKVNVFLDRREYAWSTHLVDRRKNAVELHARLELVTRAETFPLGCTSGESAEERSFLIAQALSKTIGVALTGTGFASKFFE